VDDWQAIYRQASGVWGAEERLHWQGQRG
jgi:hypothetical protein